MRKILLYIRLFLAREYKPAYFTILAVFLALSIWLNYHYYIDSRLIEKFYGSNFYFWARMAFFAIPYYFAAFLYSWLYREKKFIRSGSFWIRSLFALAILSWSYSFQSNNKYVTGMAPADAQYFVTSCLYNLTRVFTVLIPLLVFYYLFEKEKNAFYGLQVKGFKWQTYAIMLCIMAPLVFWASFRPDFQATYPQYHAGLVEKQMNIPLWQTNAIYEFCYGIDFTFVELLFRGFMVIGLMKIMGRASIFSMVAAYCYLHFGKPYFETIGSVFGGAILGVIAYYTESILGGICIHLGVAWTMDAAAYLQIYGIKK